MVSLGGKLYEQCYTRSSVSTIGGLCELSAGLGKVRRVARTMMRFVASNCRHAFIQETRMSQDPITAQKLFGDFAPKLAELTDDVLFGQVWARSQLSQRDRSLITVAALITQHRPDQLRFHLAKALENGLTQEELKEVITHLAFYAGWPSSMTAIFVAKEVMGAA